MRTRAVVIGGVATALSGAIAAGLAVLRAVPLVDAVPANDGGSSKKDDKKDMKKKGNGPRTQRKKAKKGKA